MPDKSPEDKAREKIDQIDGQELARYMKEYHVGVSTKHVYEVTNWFRLF